MKWFFEGRDDNGNILFSKFVRVSQRPIFPYMVVASESGGDKIYVPGDFQITYHGFSSNNEFTTGTLINHYEKWELFDVKVKILDNNTLQIFYSMSNYEKIT